MKLLGAILPDLLRQLADEIEGRSGGDSPALDGVTYRIRSGPEAEFAAARGGVTADSKATDDVTSDRQPESASIVARSGPKLSGCRSLVMHRSVPPLWLEREGLASNGR
jgi:hypothetical protein